RLERRDGLEQHFHSLGRLRGEELDRKNWPLAGKKLVDVHLARDGRAPTLTSMSAKASPAPAIELEGVVKRFGGTEVLRGVDLEVPAGEITVLLGPSGA